MLSAYRVAILICLRGMRMDIRQKKIEKYRDHWKNSLFCINLDLFLRNKEITRLICI